MRFNYLHAIIIFLAQLHTDICWSHYFTFVFVINSCFSFPCRLKGIRTGSKEYILTVMYLNRIIKYIANAILNTIHVDSSLKFIPINLKNAIVTNPTINGRKSACNLLILIWLISFLRFHHVSNHFLSCVLPADTDRTIPTNLGLDGLKQLFVINYYLWHLSPNCCSSFFPLLFCYK